jgi:hypothetical protein
VKPLLRPAFLFIELAYQLEQPGLGSVEITAQFGDLITESFGFG